MTSFPCCDIGPSRVLLRGQSRSRSPSDDLRHRATAAVAIPRGFLVCDEAGNPRMPAKVMRTETVREQTLMSGRHGQFGVNRAVAVGTSGSNWISRISPVNHWRGNCVGVVGRRSVLW